MAVTLCVMLWPRDGRENALAAYEDQVLSLLENHGCRLVSRVRRIEFGDGPYEVQIIEARDEAALDGFQQDPGRMALADARDHAIQRTEILRVQPV